MPKKAKPHLKVRAFIVPDAEYGGFRAILESTVYYKGKKTPVHEVYTWWGSAVPSIGLSKNSGHSCMTAITDLQKHNGHLSIFPVESEAKTYVYRVQAQLNDAVAAWKPGTPKQKDKWSVGSDGLLPFGAPPLVAGAAYKGHDIPNNKIMLKTGYWYPKEYLEDMKITIEHNDEDS